MRIRQHVRGVLFVGSVPVEIFAADRRLERAKAALMDMRDLETGSPILLPVGLADALAGARSCWRRVALRVRSAWCIVRNGQHEMYRQVEHSTLEAGGRVYRKCLLCGHESAGWALEKLPRKFAAQYSQSSYSVIQDDAAATSGAPSLLNRAGDRGRQRS